VEEVFTKHVAEAQMVKEECTEQEVEEEIVEKVK